MKPLLLFDIDHTLLRNAPGHKEAFAYAFKKVYSVDTTMDLIEHGGMTDKMVIIEVLKKKGLSEKVIMEKIGKCMNIMVRFYNKRKKELKAPRVLRGVRKLLREFDKEGYVMGLVTGNLEPIAKGKMKLAGLKKYFKFGGFGNENVNRTELVKLAVKKARKKYNYEHYTNVFVFGDTPRDIKAGREAGTITIGVSTGLYSVNRLKKSGADFTVKNLENIRQIKRIIEKN
jgi:phosphoglycolate phosphatase